MELVDVKKVKDIPICFIIGSPRSGTTMLRMLFDAHPNITIPTEHPYLLLFYNKYHKVKYWTKELLLEFYEDVKENQKFKGWTINCWSLDENRIKENLLKCEGANDFHTISKILHLSFESFYEKEETKLIADQNPVYSTQIENLMGIYDNIKFIHITRDYRDHILSIKNVPFGGEVTSLIALRWKIFFEKTLHYKRKFPHLFYSIKYEELVQHPEKYMKEMCAFLNIEYFPCILEFHKIQDDLNDLSKSTPDRERRLRLLNFHKKDLSKYHKSLLKPISSDKIDTWKKQMSDSDIRLADFMVGKYAEIAGYERKYKNINIILFLKTSPIYMHYFTQIIIGKLMLLLPTKLRFKIAARESIFEKIYAKITNKSAKQRG